VLLVEQALRVPGQRSHPDVEVRALEVEHGRKTLLPYGVLLIPDRKKRDRQCGGSGEVVLTQRGEGNVHHHLNAGIRLVVDDGPRPWPHTVKGYHHADLALVQVVDLRQSATVDRSISVVAKTDKCVV
jgi:hypothetical protein